jgi:hypothetical protein
MIMAEETMAVCVFWSFYFIITYYQSQKLQHFFWFQAFAALAVLTKPVMLYFIIPELGISLFLLLKNHDFRIVSISFIFPAVIFVQSLVSLHLTGFFHYSSIKNYNRLHYNAEVVLYKKYGLHRARYMTDSIDARAPQQQNFPAYEKFIVQKADSIIFNNWVDYTGLQVRGMFNFFLDPGRYDFEQFFHTSEQVPISFFGQIHQYGIKGIFYYLNKIDKLKLIIMAIVFLVNILCLIFYLGFLFRRSIPLFIRLISLLFICYFTVLTGPLGNSRFKTEIYLILLFSIVVFIGHYYGQNRKVNLSSH